MEKTYISAESLLRDSLALGVKIVRSGFRPSFLVGVWRGGAPIGITVQEVLEFRGLDCDHLAIRTSSYTGIDQKSKTVRVHAI
ncbi:MAG: hypoxanthine phosphoribosyltransferase, partial [Steroidobacter sp.]